MSTLIVDPAHEYSTDRGGVVDPTPPSPLGTFLSDADTLFKPSSAFTMAIPPAPSLNYNAGVGTGRKLGFPYQVPWFERFHLVPSALSLGNVLASQVTPVSMWNAFELADVTVNTITVPSGQGITLTLPSLPLTLQELSDQSFSISVDATGPPVLSTAVQVSTSEGIREIQVTGQRVTPFGFQFQAPVDERLEFEVQMLPHEDGSEQRQSYRDAPAQIIRADLRLEAFDAARFNNLMADWLARVFALPIWWEQAASTAAITGGVSTVVTVDTTNADYQVGGLAIIWESGATHEIFEIESILAGSLTATVVLTKSYGVGALVAPARLAVADPRADSAAYPVNATDASVSFTAIDNLPIEVIAFDELFNSLPVLGGLNLINQTLRYDWASTVSRTRFGARRPNTLERTDRSFVDLPWSTLLTSKADVWKYRSWMHQLDGPRLNFYVPTGRPDFILQQPIANGASSLSLVRTEYATLVRHRAPFNALTVVLKDGTLFRRSITDSATVDVDTEQVTLDAAINQAVAIEEVDRVELLLLCRMTANKSVRLQHSRVGEATFSLSARTVRQ